MPQTSGFFGEGNFNPFAPQKEEEEEEEKLIHKTPVVGFFGEGAYNPFAKRSDSGSEVSLGRALDLPFISKTDDNWMRISNSIFKFRYFKIII